MGELNLCMKLTLRVAHFTFNAAGIAYWIYWAVYMSDVSTDFNEKKFSEDYEWILELNHAYKEQDYWRGTTQASAFVTAAFIVSVCLAIAFFIPFLVEWLAGPEPLKWWSRFLLLVILGHLVFGIVLAFYGHVDMFLWCLGISLLYAVSCWLNWIHAQGYLEVYFDRNGLRSEPTDESAHYFMYPKPRPADPEFGQQPRNPMVLY